MQLKEKFTKITCKEEEKGVLPHAYKRNYCNNTEIENNTYLILNKCSRDSDIF